MRALKISMSLVLISLSCLACTSPKAIKEITVADENAVITFFLQNMLASPDAQKHFYYVEPRTTLNCLVRSVSDIPAIKPGMQKEFAGLSPNIEELIDLFFQINTAPVTVDIASDQNRGFVIDREHEIDKFRITSDAINWIKFYENHPNAVGVCIVSRPAIDRKTNLGLIHIGTQSGPLSGIGYMVLFSCENSEIRIIKKSIAWVS